MRLAGIQRDSITNGVGIRDVFFTQGCPHKCKGCHNPETWSFDGGEDVSWKEIMKILVNSDNNVTLSGGEPILADDLYNFLRICKTLGKDVWLYTGYTYEELSPAFWFKLFDLGVSVVVDGKFEEDKRDPDLLFRGSSNQRLIDLKETVYRGVVVEWNNE